MSFTIGDLFKHHHMVEKLPCDDKHTVGMELECEFEGTALNEKLTKPFAKWKATLDNSLRGASCEYVISSPIPVVDVEEQVKELLTHINKHGKVKQSSRTSFHVHVNALPLTYERVVTACVMYWLVENLVFKLMGRRREGNLFCLRLSDAEDLLGTLEQYMFNAVNNKRNLLSYLDQNQLKYSALNLFTLVKYGSLEFRGMSGENLDESLLVDWTLQCHHFLYGTTFKTPMDVLDFYYNNKEYTSTILSTLLTKEMYSRVVKQVPDIYEQRKLLSKNIGILAKFLYNSAWEEVKSIPLVHRKVISKEDYTRLRNSTELWTPEEVEAITLYEERSIQRRANAVAATLGAFTVANTPARPIAVAVQDEPIGLVGFDEVVDDDEFIDHEPEMMEDNTTGDQAP